MKRGILLIFFMLLLLGCQKSLEQRAEEAVKAEVYKSLPNPDGYEALETKVDSAFNILANDPTSLEMMAQAMKIVETGSDMKNKLERAESNIATYKELRHYGGMFRYDYDKAIKDKKELEEQIKVWIKENIEYLLKVSGRFEELDGQKFIGWKVSYKYRFKDRNGVPGIGEEVYIFSEDFKKIISSMPEATYKDMVQAWSYLQDINFPGKEELEEMLKKLEEAAG